MILDGTFDVTIFSNRGTIFLKFWVPMVTQEGRLWQQHCEPFAGEVQWQKLWVCFINKSSAKQSWQEYQGKRSDTKNQEHSRGSKKRIVFQICHEYWHWFFLLWVWLQWKTQQESIWKKLFKSIYSNNNNFIDVFNDANLWKSDIDDVLLVGGSKKQNKGLSSRSVMSILIDSFYDGYDFIEKLSRSQFKKK